MVDDVNGDRSLAALRCYNIWRQGDASMTIKLSVPDWCFYPKLGDPIYYYETLKSLGVQGVEMVDPSRYAAARAAGLEILNLSGPGMTRGLNRLEHHAELLPQIREALQHAHDHAIPLVIVFSGNRVGQSDEAGIANCRRGFEALLPEAERLGVILGFEMLNSSDHTDYQADRGEYGFRLAQEIRSPWFKLVYDIYHTEKMGDRSAPDIIAHLDLIAHLHTAESPRRDAPRADGNIRYCEIVPQVLAAGYAGYWGLEFVPGEAPLHELHESIQLFQSLAG
jgi:hydroxypyruvate isomerase